MFRRGTEGRLYRLLLVLSFSPAFIREEHFDGRLFGVHVFGYSHISC